MAIKIGVSLVLPFDIPSWLNPRDTPFSEIHGENVEAFVNFSLKSPSTHETQYRVMISEFREVNLLFNKLFDFI